MAEDRKASPDETHEHGVLDDVGIDTTAIDLGSPTRVSVSLPAGYRDDDSDDDVTADELTEDELAATTERAVGTGDDADGVHEADNEDLDDSASEDESDGIADVDTADEETADEDTADENTVDADLADDDAAEEDLDDDTPDEAAADADAVSDAHELGDADDAHRDEDDAPDGTPDPGDDESFAGIEALELDEESDMAEQAGVDGGADDTPEPTPPARTTTPRAPRESFIRPAGNRSDAAEPAATSAREPLARPASRRLDDLESDSARESSDVLTDDRLLDTGAIRRPEPEDPWRRIVYAATRGLINLGDSKKTRQRKELISRIASPLGGRARFVPVLSRKGGVGKTTVTALLGMALADARDDRVVAIDANPDRGTLAERISKPSGKTVRDLVRGRDDVRGYGDLSAHVVRDRTRLDVLASDADPHVADAFSDSDYRSVSELAQHYYSLVLTDTGTGIVHSVMDATLDLADQLVIVSGISVDEARLASETLTWLESNGRAEQAKNAIVVINQDAQGTPLVRLDELESHFRTRARDVVRIPYDSRIATGSTIPFHELDRRTRDAARRLAALVVEGIRSA